MAIGHHHHHRHYRQSESHHHNIPQNLFPEDTAMKRPEGLDRKISVEQGGKKKISVDRAQVMILMIMMTTMIIIITVTMMITMIMMMIMMIIMMIIIIINLESKGKGGGVSQ